MLYRKQRAAMARMVLSLTQQVTQQYKGHSLIAEGDWADLLFLGMCIVICDAEGHATTATNLAGALGMPRTETLRRLAKLTEEGSPQEG